MPNDPKTKMRKKVATFLGRGRMESIIGQHEKTHRMDMENLQHYFIANYDNYSEQVEDKIVDMIRQAR